MYSKIFLLLAIVFFSFNSNAQFLVGGGGNLLKYTGSFYGKSNFGAGVKIAYNTNAIKLVPQKSGRPSKSGSKKNSFFAEFNYYLPVTYNYLVSAKNINDSILYVDCNNKIYNLQIYAGLNLAVIGDFNNSFAWYIILGAGITKRDINVNIGNYDKNYVLEDSNQNDRTSSAPLIGLGTGMHFDLGFSYLRTNFLYRPGLSGHDPYYRINLSLLVPVKFGGKKH